MPDFKELVKNLYATKGRELTEEKLSYIETNYGKGKEEEFVKNFYATIGEELPQEKFDYIRDTYLKKKEDGGIPYRTPSAPVAPSFGTPSVVEASEQLESQSKLTPPQKGGVGKLDLSKGVPVKPLSGDMPIGQLKVEKDLQRIQQSVPKVGRETMYKNAIKSNENKARLAEEKMLQIQPLLQEVDNIQQAGGEVPQELINQYNNALPTYNALLEQRNKSIDNIEYFNNALEGNRRLAASYTDSGFKSRFLNQGLDNLGSLVMNSIAGTSRLLKQALPPHLAVQAEIARNISQREGDKLKARAEYTTALMDEKDNYLNKEIDDIYKEQGLVGATEYALKKFTESLPVTLGIMTASATGTGGAVLANTALFGGSANQRYEELKDRTDMTEEQKIANAVGYGSAELLFEGVLSSGMSAVYKQMIKTMGKEAAEKAIKKNVIDLVTNGVKKYMPLSGAVVEGVGEGATQLTQNIVDKYTHPTKKDMDVMEGVGNAAAIGFAGGGAMSAPTVLTYVNRSKNVEKNKEIEKKREAIQTELAKPISESTKEILQQTDNELMQEQNELVVEDMKDLTEKLPEEQKEEVKVLAEERRQIENALAETESEEVKTALENKTKQIGEQIDNIYDRAKEPIIGRTDVTQEGLGVATETGTQGVTREGVPSEEVEVERVVGGERNLDVSKEQNKGVEISELKKQINKGLGSDMKITPSEVTELNKLEFSVLPKNDIDNSDINKPIILIRKRGFPYMSITDALADIGEEGLGGKPINSLSDYYEIVDGRHRIKKAIKEGKGLNAVVITEAEYEKATGVKLYSKEVQSILDNIGVRTIEEGIDFLEGNTSTESVGNLDVLIEEKRFRDSNDKKVTLKATEEKVSDALKDVESTARALGKIKLIDDETVRSYGSWGLGESQYVDSSGVYTELPDSAATPIEGIYKLEIIPISSTNYFFEKDKKGNPLLSREYWEFDNEDGYQTKNLDKIKKGFDTNKREPIIVESTKDGLHYVVDGHHRLTVAKELGRKSILALVRQHDGKEALGGKNDNYTFISEAYHKAKADGSNPELVQAVETLLKPKEYATQEIKQPKGVRTEPKGGIKGGETKTPSVSDSVQRAKESEKEREVAEGEEIKISKKTRNGISKTQSEKSDTFAVQRKTSIDTEGADANARNEAKRAEVKSALTKLRDEGLLKTADKSLIGKAKKMLGVKSAAMSDAEIDAQMALMDAMAIVWKKTTGNDNFYETFIADIKKGDLAELKKMGGALFQDSENPKKPSSRITLAVFDAPQFEKMKGLQVTPQSISDLVKGRGKQIEKDIINMVLDYDKYKGQKRISFDEFRGDVETQIMKLEKIRTRSYADYGYDNLGDNENYGQTETVIFNSPIEHGEKGHFSGDFTTEGLDKIEWELRQIPNTDKWAAVDKNMPSNVTANNLSEYIGTAGEKIEVEKWIADRDKENNGGLNKGLFGHIRKWFNKRTGVFNIAELQSDYYQKNKASDLLKPEVSSEEVDAHMNKNVWLPMDREISEKIKKDWGITVKKTDDSFIAYDKDGKELSSIFFRETPSVGLNKGDFEENQVVVSALRKLSERRANDEKLEDGTYKVTITEFGEGVDEFYFKTYTEAENFIKINDGRFNGAQDDYNSIRSDYQEKRQKIRQIEEQKFIQNRQAELEKTKPVNIQLKQFVASQKVHELRLLREAIKMAADEGAETVRFPSQYTLAVIEGYVDATGEGRAPYEVVSGDYDRLYEGDIIDYGGDDMIVVEQDRSTITVAPKDEVSVFNIYDLVEDETTYRVDEIEYEAKRYFVNIDAITREEVEVYEPSEWMGEYAKLLLEEYFQENESEETVRWKDISSDLYDKVRLSYDSMDVEDILSWSGKIWQDGDTIYAIEGRNYETFSQPDEYEPSSTEEDYYDNLSSEQRTVVDKYGELGKQFEKMRPDSRVVRDDNGMVWLETTITEEDKNNPIVAFQEEGGKVKGAIDFTNNNKATLYIFDGADISTLAHEMSGHLGRRVLERLAEANPDFAKQYEAVKKWAGVKDVWTTKAEEKFARAFERYLRNGVAPTKALKEVFSKLKEWLSNVYKVIKNSSIDINLTNDVRETFDALLGKEMFKPTAKERVGQVEPTETEITQTAQKAGVTPKNLRDLYKINRELFGLDRIKSFASAIAMDRMVGAMAKRAGVTKSEMYGRLKFEKANEANLPQGVKMQVDAWHGSPYQFDKFTTEKIGTGEGAQAFGWGLYFTDLESIARSYANMANTKQASYNILQSQSFKDFTKDISENSLISAILNLFDTYSSVDGVSKNRIIEEYKEVIEDKNKRIKQKGENWSLKSQFERDIKSYENLISFLNKKSENDILNALKNFKNEKEFSRNLYKVSIHKGKTPDQYTWLEWDKPFSENLLQRIIKQGTKENVMPKLTKDLDGYSGKEIYNILKNNIFNSNKEASLFLLRAGIDGIKYPAESISRGATSDTARGFNYVVFDENAVSIEEVIKFQKDAEKARGAVMVSMDGQAVIYALTDPNVSTPLHEMAHVFEHYLTDAERAAVQNWAGTKAWTTQTSEAFARGFEKYLAEGKAPTPALQKIFEKFKQWLTDIYNGIKGSEIDIELNDQMREIYAKMLGAEAVTPTKAERKAIASAKIDEIANALKDILPKIEGEKLGIGQDEIIDVIAKAVKALVNTGIEIDEAIKQVKARLSEAFDGVEGIDEERIKVIVEGTKPPVGKKTRAIGERYTKKGYKLPDSIKYYQPMVTEEVENWAKDFYDQYGYEGAIAYIEDIPMDANPETRVILGKEVMKRTDELFKKATSPEEIDELKTRYYRVLNQVAPAATTAARTMNFMKSFYSANPFVHVEEVQRAFDAINQTKIANAQKMINELLKINGVVASQVANNVVNNTSVKSKVEKAKRNYESSKAEAKKLWQALSSFGIAETPWERARKNVKFDKALAKLAKDFIVYQSVKFEAFLKEVAASFGIAENDIDKDHLKSIFDGVKSKEIQKGIKGSLRDLDIKFKQLIEEHYTDVEAAKESLADKLSKEFGLAENDAKEVAELVRKEFNKLTYAEKLKQLKNSGLKKGGWWDTIIDLSNAGALSEDIVREQFAKELGIAELTPEIEAKLIELSKAIRSAPENTQERARRIIDLEDYKKKVSAKFGFKDYLIGTFLTNIFGSMGANEINMVHNIVRTKMYIASEVAGLALKGDVKQLSLMFNALANGYKNGYRNFSEVFKTGKLSYKDVGEIKARNIWELMQIVPEKDLPLYENAMRSIGYLWLTHNRFWSRMLQSFDALSGTANYEIASLFTAIDKADELGLKGSEREKFIKEQIARNPESVAKAKAKAKQDGLKEGTKAFRERVEDYIKEQRPKWLNERAKNTGQRLTLTQAPDSSTLTGYVANVFNKVISDKPFIKFIMPVTNTISNLFITQYEHTPLEAINWLTQVVKNKRKEDIPFNKAFSNAMKDPEMRRRLWATMTGTAAGVALFALAGGFDKEENCFEIFGAGSGDIELDNYKKSTGWKPYSVRFNCDGDYYSYQWMPLFAMLVGMVGDLRDYTKYGKDGLKDIQDKVAKNMFNQSYDVLNDEQKSKVYAEIISGKYNYDEIQGKQWGYVFANIATTPAKLFLNYGFMTTLKDMFEIASGKEQTAKKAVSLAARTSLASVPVVGAGWVREVKQSLDPNIYKTTSFKDEILKNIPFVEMPNKVKIDGYGRNVTFYDETSQTKVGYLLSRRFKSNARGTDLDAFWSTNGIKITPPDNTEFYNDENYQYYAIKTGEILYDLHNQMFERGDFEGRTPEDLKEIVRKTSVAVRNVVKGAIKNGADMKDREDLIKTGMKSVEIGREIAAQNVAKGQKKLEKLSEKQLKLKEELEKNKSMEEKIQYIISLRDKAGNTWSSKYRKDLNRILSSDVIDRIRQLEKSGEISPKLGIKKPESFE
jgi:hypothetical protein